MNDKNINYVQISLTILKKFTRSLKFALYIHRTDTKFTKIFKKGDQLDWDRINTYKEKGLHYFFVTNDDYKIYSLILERLGEYLNEPKNKINLEDSVEILKELSNLTLSEVIDNTNLDQRIINNASNVVEGCIDILARDPATMVQILKQVSSQKYILKHSMAVSIFSVLLAQASGMQSQININIIGLGGFLHDIGVGQLTFDPEDMKLLTAGQRKEMWRHPELGKNLLDRIKNIRSEVSKIVLQHHEQPNGHGYPNGLSGSEIYYPAKIIAITDAFSAMITKRSFRDSMNNHQAIAKLVDQPGHFDKNLVKTFKELVLPSK